MLSNTDMAQVLVVDDNTDARKLAMAALEVAGIDAVGCSSGAEALTLLETDHDIKAVVLDLSMPVLDGLSVAEEIRMNEKLHPEKDPVHIAFLTAKIVDEPVVRVAERTHVDHIIKKDGDVHGFQDKVKEMLAA